MMVCVSRWVESPLCVTGCLMGQCKSFTAWWWLECVGRTVRSCFIHQGYWNLTPPTDLYPDPLDWFRKSFKLWKSFQNNWLVEPSVCHVRPLTLAAVSCFHHKSIFSAGNRLVHWPCDWLITIEIGPFQDESTIIPIWDIIPAIGWLSDSSCFHWCLLDTVKLKIKANETNNISSITVPQQNVNVLH